MRRVVRHCYTLTGFCGFQFFLCHSIAVLHQVRRFMQSVKALRVWGGFAWTVLAGCFSAFVSHWVNTGKPHSFHVAAACISVCCANGPERAKKIRGDDGKKIYSS